MRKYDSVIFDLDGTLMDSGPGIIRCVKLAFDELGIDYDRSPEAMRLFVGPPFSVTFPRAGVPADLLEEAIRLYRSHYNDGNGKFDAHPYEGMEALLETLRHDGYRLYVATSKPEAVAVEILEHFRLKRYFRIIAGATTDHTRENKNDVIAYLLNQIGDAGHAVMVGDTVYDVKGAADMRLPCIGVSWGYGDAGEMKAAGAIGIADTPAEIRKFL